RALLDRAGELAERRSGTADGVPFDDIRDSDDVLGPVLEVFASSSYFWVPWEHVQFLEIAAPKSLRDLLWIPARFASFDGQIGEVYLPVLYPGSSASQDDAIRLGLKTDWLESGGIVRGVGRKTLLVGEGARTLPDLREVHFPRPQDQPDHGNAGDDRRGSPPCSHHGRAALGQERRVRSG